MGGWSKRRGCLGEMAVQHSAGMSELVGFACSSEVLQRAVFASKPVDQAEPKQVPDNSG